MPRLLILNHVALLACCSIYLGTGITLVFFQFPLAPKLTIDNYYLVMVEPVARATQLLTWVTIVIFVTGFVMLATEWFTGIRWVPVVVLAAFTAATLITTQVLIPKYNLPLAAHAVSAAQFPGLLRSWMAVNRLRVSLWVVAWAAMAWWFYAMAWKSAGGSMNDALIRLALILIAAITVISGAIQMLAPGLLLGVIGASRIAPTPHLFATIGMFMVVTGAMFLQTLVTRSTEPAVPLWIGVQKIAAAALVGLGVMRGVFGPLALGVAGFDFASGLLTFLFLARIAE